MQLLTIFPMLQYDFMRHAFLAAVLIAPLFALLGTMAVNNKMAFFSDALGHSAFTGIGLGVLLGMQEPLLAMLAFGIFLGLVITKVKSANMVSSDTVISVFSSAAMALGIVILSASGGFCKIFLLFDWGYSDGRAEGFMDDRDCACCGVCAVGIVV